MTPFSIGTIVEYRHKGACDSFIRGRVVAIENYTDGNGTRTWYFIRWMCPSGKPDHEPMKHCADELSVWEKTK